MNVLAKFDSEIETGHEILRDNFDLQSLKKLVVALDKISTA